MRDDGQRYSIFALVLCGLALIAGVGLWFGYERFARDEAKNPSNDFRFAAGVTAWGLILRDSEYKSKATYDLVITEATAGQGRDLDGLRKEFIDLATAAKKLQPVPKAER